MHRHTRDPNEIYIDSPPLSPYEETDSYQDKENAGPGRNETHNPHSRPKKRCRFGPSKRRHLGDGHPGNSNQERGRGHLHTISVVQQRQPLAPTQAYGTRVTHERRTSTPSHHGSKIRNNQTHIDHTTLTLPLFHRSTPLERYKYHLPVEPPPSPFRFAHTKLGLTESEFGEQMANEIDALLQEIDIERRQALLEDLPLNRALSKEDCLQFFSATAIPPAGALRGVYCWAADLNYAEDAALITGKSSHTQPNNDEQSV